MLKIIIASEYSETPGGRFKHEGSFSGQDFREQLLLPKYKQALSNSEPLYIDLDGGYGYSSSFLEEAFGGLVRTLDLNDSLKMLEILKIKSHDEPRLVSIIKEYIEDAIKLKKVEK